VSTIHPAAHVDPKASIGDDVCVGPGAVIGPDVQLGDGCEIGAHVVIEGQAELGPGCRIFPSAVIGTEGQYTNLDGPGGRVVIGARTVVREMATVHRSIKEDGLTQVGESCYLMVLSHVAHDCILSDRVILTNSTSLSGHVEVGNDVFITGLVGIHQFVRIGEGVILTGPSAVRKDIPPFTNADGNPPVIRGLNTIGLRRTGVSAEVRGHLKQAYRILFDEAKIVEDALGRIEEELPLGREIQSVLDFMRSSERGIYRGGV
jgi:UDP-N-acetylglucosamine acyltransferase